jgi:hypothetical protein
MAGGIYIRLNLSGVILRRVFLENLEILPNAIHRRFFPTDFPSATNFLKVKSVLPQLSLKLYIIGKKSNVKGKSKEN